MKKILLATSALAFAGTASSSANAAEWDLDWGGYFEGYIGFASVDSASGTDFDGVDTRQDTEIQFTPKITLDNGIQFGVNIQLEGNTSGDTIDESFIFIKGSFGEILLGSENSAGYKMSYGAPDVSALGVNSGSVSAYVPIQGNFFRNPGRSSFVEVDGNNDSQRITYFTPRFSGFQLGVSYARDGLQDSSGAVNIDAAGTINNIFDVGANYVATFGAFDVAVAGRYGTASVEGAADDPETFALGLNLGYAGFTVGGSYADEDGGNTANDGSFYDVGVKYETGPWGGSLTYANSDLDALGEMDQYIAAVSYKLGPGVKAGGSILYLEQDAGRGGNEAFVIETGVTLSF